MRRLLAAVAMVMFAQAPGFSYLPEFTKPAGGGAPQPNRWDFTAFKVVWNLNPSISGTKISGSRNVADVIQASFATWTSAPNAVLPISRGGDTSITSPALVGTNTIAFTCTGTQCDFSKDAETLAVTFTFASDQAGQNDMHGGKSGFVGQILDADIFFNPSTVYSTDGPSATATDLQTVATHEIGHFLGLDHSGIVRAVMFPFAPSMEHTLSYDDVAAISVLYPKASPDVATGSIAGRVTQAANGAGIFGAHVYADSTTNAQAFGGNIRKSPIGTLSATDGSYVIMGLPADSYIVIAAPLDGPFDSTNVDFGQAFGATIQTNFTTRWH